MPIFPNRPKSWFGSCPEYGTVDKAAGVGFPGMGICSIHNRKVFSIYEIFDFFISIYYN